MAIGYTLDRKEDSWIAIYSITYQWVERWGKIASFSSYRVSTGLTGSLLILQGLYWPLPSKQMIQTVKSERTEATGFAQYLK